MTTNILGTVKHIIIETNTKKPVPIAPISDDKIDVAEGYRVRVKPTVEG